MSLTKYIAEITQAFLVNNKVSAEAVPRLIQSIHHALIEISGESTVESRELSVAVEEPQSTASVGPPLPRNRKRLPLESHKRWSPNNPR